YAAAGRAAGDEDDIAVAALAGSDIDGRAQSHGFREHGRTLAAGELEAFPGLVRNTFRVLYPYRFGGGGDLGNFVNLEPDRFRDGIDDARRGEFPRIEPCEGAGIRSLEIEDHPGMRGARGGGPGVAHQDGDIAGPKNHDLLHL